VLLDQRLTLEKVGWGIGNKDLLALFEKVCHLKEEHLSRIRAMVAKAG
jgi:hypothetical protein